MENIKENLSSLIGSDVSEDALKIVKILVERRNKKDNKFIANSIVYAVTILKMCDENFINSINKEEVEKIIKVLER